jgi:hypothetical protein
MFQRILLPEQGRSCFTRGEYDLSFIELMERGGYALCSHKILYLRCGCNGGKYYQGRCDNEEPHTFIDL